jgi:hypothetical protein
MGHTSGIALEQPAVFVGKPQSYWQHVKYFIQRQFAPDNLFFSLFALMNLPSQLSVENKQKPCADGQQHNDKYGGKESPARKTNGLSVFSRHMLR